MAVEENFKWYSIKTVTGQEKKVKTFIETELHREGLSSYLKQILIPLEKVVQLRRGKKVQVERNFFPGYVFLEVNLMAEVLHTIKNVSGVAKFLPDNSKPEPLRPSEVNRFLGKVDELNESPENVEVPFMVGETVKVIDGPFNGFVGVIEDINEEKKKLKVIVKIFGRRTPLELNYIQVEKE